MTFWTYELLWNLDNDDDYNKTSKSGEKSEIVAESRSSCELFLNFLEFFRGYESGMSPELFFNSSLVESAKWQYHKLINM